MCLLDTDCPVGEICSDGTCVPGIADIVDGDVFTGECRRDLDCTPAYYCEDEFCVPKPVTSDGDDPTDGDDLIDGDKADGDITGDGDQPDGDEIRTDGDAADGDAIDGDAIDPDGDDVQSDGDQIDGDLADGDLPDGDLPDGDSSDGDELDGDEPDGDEPVDGDVPSCSVQGCDSGSESRAGCGNARTIGRLEASYGLGYSTSFADTCNAGNHFNGAPVGGCAGQGQGNDHVYRIFLLNGEEIFISFIPFTQCDFSMDDPYFLFSIWTASECQDKVCPTALYCESGVTTMNSLSGTFTATADAWYFLVIDGETADDGDYILDVDLTCEAAGCGCQ